VKVKRLTFTFFLEIPGKVEILHKIHSHETLKESYYMIRNNKNNNAFLIGGS